jgi:hypothetical protein
LAREHTTYRAPSTLDLGSDGPPFGSRPASTRSTRVLITAGILCGMLVLAGVGVFIVLGFGIKSASNKITDDQRAAAADVTVTGCSRDKSTGFMTASITITNHGPEAASYVVDVAFDSVDGKRQFDDGVAAADNLASGQVSTVRANSFAVAPAAFTCRLVEATKF